MNYTKNHHLPQWVKSDRIMMDDFNQMCQDIESGLNTAVSKANAAQTAAGTAQSTANTALSSRPYVVGSYTGNGGTQSINLGFKPAFLIVSGMRETSETSSILAYTRCYTMTAGGQELDTRLKLTSTGFTVYPKPHQTNNYPFFNEETRVYDYIAFK